MRSYFTILIDYLNTEDGSLTCTARSWSKKIYDDKQQAIEALIEMRKNYSWSGMRYKIVELRVVNEFEA